MRTLWGDKGRSERKKIKIVATVCRLAISITKMRPVDDILADPDNLNLSPLVSPIIYGSHK